MGTHHIEDHDTRQEALEARKSLEASGKWDSVISFIVICSNPACAPHRVPQQCTCEPKQGEV
jgi:hypothetical protein